MIDNELLKFDLDQLEVEANLQPELFLKWANLAAEAREEFSRLKLESSVVESEVMLKIRKNPDRYGLDKSTESAIKEKANTNPQLKKIRQRVIQAKGELDLLENAVAALEQRKRMIEIAVTLHGQSYFAGPSSPRNYETVKADLRKRRHEKALDIQKKKLSNKSIKKKTRKNNG